MGRQIKVTKFGIHKSIPNSHFKKYQNAGWSMVAEVDYSLYYQSRKEREQDGNKSNRSIEASQE